MIALITYAGQAGVQDRATFILSEAFTVIATVFHVVGMGH